METDQISGHYVSEILSDYEDNDHTADTEKICEFFGNSMPDFYDDSLSEEKGYLVDLDGDCQDELILYVDFGGTGGFTEVHVWKKNEEEIPEEIGTFNEFRGYEALLSYEGDYYYVIRNYNFNTRETTGFEVLSLNTDGTIAQHRINLENKENEKEWNMTYCNENMSEELRRQFENYLEEIRSDLQNMTVPTDDYELFRGQAEVLYAEAEQDFEVGTYRSIPNCVVVDFDNDGENECIEKRIWYPSSLNSELALIAGFYKKYNSYEHEVFINSPASVKNNDSGIAYTISVQLWFEEFENQIYIFQLKRVDWTSDYILEISLIEGDKMHPMFQYLLVAEKKYTYE